MLKDSAINAEDIIDLLPEHIYWKDTNCRLLGCNKESLEFFGLNSLEEYIGKTEHDLMPEEQAENIIAIDKEVMGTKKSMIMEEYVLDPQGRRIVYLSNKKPIFDKSGEVIGILGVSINITERKKLEQQLAEAKHEAERANQERINLLAVLNQQVTGQKPNKGKSAEEYAVGMLSYLDYIISLVPGNVYWRDKHGKFLGCNDNQRKMLNLESREDYIGKTYEDFYDPDFASELRRNDNEVMEDDITTTKEEAVIRDGKLVTTYLTSKVPLHDNNNVIGLLGVSIDISDRKKAEKALLEAKVLHERVTNMRLYGASIAHELRTPLRSIESGFHGVHKKLDKLIDGYKQAQNAKLPVQFLAKTEIESLDEVLDVINDEMRSAFVIVEMMLARSKTANINPEALEAISMVDCINNALKRYPFQEGEREKIHLQIENDFEFLGEIPLATHILFNLIKNSLYFTKAARKGEIYIRLERGEKNNRLYFKDTGSGIPEDIVSKIFQPFFTTTEFGTGAGLAFCQQVMNGFGGEIGCLSHLGEYAEFILTFSADVEACRQSLTQKSGKCLQ